MGYGESLSWQFDYGAHRPRVPERFGDIEHDKVYGGVGIRSHQGEL